MTDFETLIVFILQEVDSDIREVMLTECKTKGNEGYRYYSLLQDPSMTILKLQEIRNAKPSCKTTR